MRLSQSIEMMGEKDKKGIKMNSFNNKQTKLLCIQMTSTYAYDAHFT